MQSNINSTITSLNSLVSGLKKNQPKGLFLIGGTKYTTAELVTIMQAIVTALLAVPPARGAYLKAARSADTLQEQSHAVIRDLKQLLQLQGSDDTAALADYGLTPRKSTGIKSPKVKVVAADKAQATRAARHTMGPKQRLQITGATVAAAAAAASSAPLAPTGTPVAAGNTIVAAPTSATPAVTPGH